MQDLLKDLGKIPQPLNVRSRTGLIRLLKRIRLHILRKSLNLDSVGPTEEQISTVRQYALWLEDLGFESFSKQSDEFDEEELYSVFSTATTLYEYVGRTTQSDTLSIFDGPLNDFLRSAVVSSFTPFQAHSSLVGKRLAQRIEGVETSNIAEQCHKYVASMVCNFVGREFQRTFITSQRLLSIKLDSVEFLKKIDATYQELLSLDRAFAIGNATSCAALGMLLGIPTQIKKAEQLLTRVEKVSKEMLSGNHIWLASSLKLVISEMYAASMHRILSDVGLPEDYRNLLAHDGYLEFWGPQLEAIKRGLLENGQRKHFVVSIPTGAGKSLFAELGIAGSLMRNNEGWAGYVAPSRALVNQINLDLRQRLGNCGIKVQTILAGAEKSLAEVLKRFSKVADY